MVLVFSDSERQANFAKYRQQWEASMLASVIAGSADLDDADRKEILRAILEGSFNGAAFGVYGADELCGGSLEWTQAGPTQFDLVYKSAYLTGCKIARVYTQPDGSWGALVVAGVKDDAYAAMASAEWAIARLSS